MNLTAVVGERITLLTEAGIRPTSVREVRKSSKQKVLAKAVVSDKMEIVLVGVTKVVVYDALGNIVHSGDKPTWDLRNAAGRYVANGAYLVVVETRDGVHSVKVGVKR